MVEDADILSDAIDGVIFTAMHIADPRIHALNDGAIRQYGKVRPVQDCVDEVIEAGQMLSFYDDACNVRAVVPKLVEEIVDVVCNMDLETIRLQQARDGTGNCRL